MQLPWMPDVPIHGNAWVTESSPTVLRIHERATVAGLPARFDMVLARVGERQLDYHVGGTVGGMSLPAMHKRFDIVDAGRGWIELRNAADASEPHSELRMTSDGLHVRVIGPGGFTDDRVEPVVQPGEPGYVEPPAR